MHTAALPGGNHEPTAGNLMSDHLPRVLECMPYVSKISSMRDPGRLHHAGYRAGKLAHPT